MTPPPPPAHNMRDTTASRVCCVWSGRGVTREIHSWGGGGWSGQMSPPQLRHYNPCHRNEYRWLSVAGGHFAGAWSWDCRTLLQTNLRTSLKWENWFLRWEPQQRKWLQGKSCEGLGPLRWASICDIGPVSMWSWVEVSYELSLIPDWDGHFHLNVDNINQHVQGRLHGRPTAITLTQHPKWRCRWCWPKCCDTGFFYP